jgi:hypothetical protein
MKHETHRFQSYIVTSHWLLFKEILVHIAGTLATRFATNHEHNNFVQCPGDKNSFEVTVLNLAR